MKEERGELSFVRVINESAEVLRVTGYTERTG